MGKLRAFLNLFAPPPEPNEHRSGNVEDPDEERSFGMVVWAVVVAVVWHGYYIVVKGGHSNGPSGAALLLDREVVERLTFSQFFVGSPRFEIVRSSSSSGLFRAAHPARHGGVQLQVRRRLVVSGHGQGLGGAEVDVDRLRRRGCRRPSGQGGQRTPGRFGRTDGAQSRRLREWRRGQSRVGRWGRPSSPGG